MSIPKIFKVYLYFEPSKPSESSELSKSLELSESSELSKRSKITQQRNELIDMMTKIDVEPIIKKIDDPIEDTTNKFKDPCIYVSIGKDWNIFKPLIGLPVYEKNRWVHFNEISEIKMYKLFYCWLSASDPFPISKEISLTKLSVDLPLVSLFTSTFRSGNRIQRPYQSLLKQTYTNWEWVILDDSGDNDETWNNILVNLKDKRIRKYQQAERSGRIGSVKKDVAGLCRGQILVELDHDDELTPDCLLRIVDAFIQHPDCGFVYGDFCEVYEDTNNAHWYGWDAGYGYLTYWREYVPGMKRWQNVCKTPNLNWKTIRHLIGLPNHPRAWRSDLYHLIGGHRAELTVADDYDLLVRTFLATKMVRIPHLLYIQYRNTNQNNQTFQRNQQIQTLCHYLELYYRDRIDKRLSDLDMPSLANESYNRIYRRPSSHPCHQQASIDHLCPSCKCYIFPITSSSVLKQIQPSLEKAIKKCQENGWHHYNLIVVGIVPQFIEELAATSPPGSVRWWPFDHSIKKEEAVRWAMQIRPGALTIIKSGK